MTTLDRRAVLVGACGTCAVVVTGCAAYGPAQPGGASAGAAGAKLAATKDVPVGGGVILANDGLVVTQPEEGTFKAFSSKCTHQGCQVTKVSSTIDCPCHNSKFSIADGSPQSGPANSPLPETAIKVDGDNITTA